MNKFRCLFFLLSLSCFITEAWTQGVAVNTANLPPDSSAMLDVQSTTKGMLVPRMTGIEMEIISNPATGLLVFCTDLNCFFMNKGTPGDPDWIVMSTQWKSIGSDVYYSGGNVGIGTPVIDYDLDIRGSNTDDGSYLQLANVDLTHKLVFFSGRENHPNPFINWKAGDPLRFATDEGGWSEKMRISGDGKVGIGITSPVLPLDVKDSLGINGTRLLYLPDQADFIGSVIFGNGGSNLIHVSGSQGQHNTGVGINALLSNTEGSNNTATGSGTLKNNTTGYRNTAVGAQALNTNMDGYYNTATGYTSMYSNTDGTYNTANGTASLYTNSEGDNNTASGHAALYYNTTGSSNTANGIYALFSNTIGFGNTAVGQQAMYYNKANSRSTAVGYKAMFNADDDATGRLTYNTAIGSEALSGGETPADNTGGSNTATGYRSLFSNTSGSSNTASGVNAMYNNMSGEKNAAYGYGALYNSTLGNYNTAIGSGAEYYNQEGSHNTVIGFEAGKGTSGHSKSGNVLIGYRAGFNVTTSNRLFIENSDSDTPLIWGDFENDTVRINGTMDIADEYHFPLNDGSDGQVLKTDGNGSLSWSDDQGAIRINDLIDAKTGGNSVFLGSGAGAVDDTTDNQNVAVGIGSLFMNTTGTSNTAIGYQALYSNVISWYNTAIGHNALKSHTGVGGASTAIGAFCLSYDTSGYQNTAIGWCALQSNLSGHGSTAIGTTASRENTTGNNNTAIGTGANYKTTIGSGNTVIGTSANYFNVAGSNNTIIGYEAGMNQSFKSGCVFLGNRAGYNESGNDKLCIDNSDTTAPLIYGQFNNNLVRINGNFGIGTQSFGNGSKVLALINGTIPSNSIPNGILLYAEDVSGSSELTVRDEAGNTTVLSPHNFSMIHKSEPMAWSFYSENHQIEKKINVDMLRLVRIVEEISGEKLVFIKNMNEDDNQDISEIELEGIIQKQQREIDELRDQLAELQIVIEELIDAR